MFYAELGGKLAAGVLTAFFVWLAVAVAVAIPVGRMAALADADKPAVDCVCDDPAPAGDVCNSCGGVLL